MLDNNETLKTLQQQIEDETNRLLSVNNELARMKRLHSSEDFAVAELQGLKADISTSITTNKILKEKLEKEVEDLRTEKDNLNQDIVELRKLIVTENSTSEAKKSELDKIEASLNDLTKSLNQKEKKLTTKEADLVSREETLAGKHSAIKDFITTIK